MLLYTSTFKIALRNFAISTLCNAISNCAHANLATQFRNWLAISQFLFCTEQFWNCVNCKLRGTYACFSRMVISCCENSEVSTTIHGVQYKPVSLFFPFKLLPSACGSYMILYLLTQRMMVHVGIATWQRVCTVIWEFFTWKILFSERFLLTDLRYTHTCNAQ